MYICDSEDPHSSLRIQVGGGPWLSTLLNPLSYQLKHLGELSALRCILSSKLICGKIPGAIRLLILNLLCGDWLITSIDFGKSMDYNYPPIFLHPHEHV